MAKTIILVGGILPEVDHAKVLRELNTRTQEHEISWEWVHCDQSTHFEPPKNPFGRALEIARQAKKKKAADGDSQNELIVVKLFHLSGRSQARLYAAYPDPVLVPQHIDDGQAAIDWLLSGEANLVPRHEWFATREEAAIVAILAKLIRNKSWNKDAQGHNWTKEDDLLGQSPVLRSDFQDVAVEARRMLQRLDGILLLKKGSGQGRTPREWSINLLRLAQVKQSILEATLAPLGSIPRLKQLIAGAANGERVYRLDEAVVTERVRQVCRDQH